MAYQLKPFVINLGDLSFILKQINFRPLFDADGNAVVNWDGVGNVYTSDNTTIVGGLVAGDAASLDAINAFGVGFPSTTAPIGVRDVTGYHNNLYGTQAFWGAADQVFRRDVAADFTHYITPNTTNNAGTYLANNGGLDSNPYAPGAQAYTAGSDYTTTVDSLGVHQSNVVDYTPRMISRTITTGGVNLLADANGHYVAWDSARYASDSTYAALVDASGVVIANLVEGAKIVAPINTALQLLDAHGAPVVWDIPTYIGSAVYASTLATYSAASFGGLFGSATGGALVPGGQIYIQSSPGVFTALVDGSLAPVLYNQDLLQYKQLIDASGVSFTSLTSGQPITYGGVTQSGYGLLEQLGHIDFQHPDSGEFFIGSENPGVSPVNSWFGIFGQFFDHGLDKLSAGGQHTTVKIALAVDDPLYGVLGPDGQPVTSITINRATVVGDDANGDPTFKNSTSPFIDQSQTYGSSDQITNLLREWVSTDGGLTFHAGMKLFDGTTLADAWERRWPDGTTSMVHDTLPTLNELRDHVLDTNRAAITWEDVTNFHNRDANGALATGDSGQPLLLDMNPRFDAAHLDATTAVGTSTVDAIIDAAVATLAGATGSADLVFGRTGLDGVSGGIKLTVTNGAGGPYMPDGTYTGANALALWVNFSNFSITAPAGAVHDAVGQILMAAVGDHYIAGDGRVNENFGLTAIHHVFHEEHNYQVENLKTWIYAHDANNTPGTHAGLHEWQIDTGTQDANGNFIYVNGAGTADDVIAWDADKMFTGSKLIVEMEYQHAAVDQYARTVTPRIQEFVGYSSSVDPTISLEYAQTAFRFGHSTIRETIDTIDPSGWFKGHVTTYALEAAFLTPSSFAAEGAAAITLGLSRQQMNEVDEFITPALNQGLLGQPLDLAAINIARGRDMGIPTLNDFRAAIGLTRYVSWSDFGLNMIHPESLVNFIAAYSFDGDVAKATEIMALADGTLAGPGAISGLTAAKAIAFMHNDTSAGTIVGADGFNHIDSWMGGLAEAHVPGGLLGETFDAVFVAQIQALMDGDRFYYLYRLFGTQIGEEVNNGQFKDIVERNTGLSHLNGSIFAYADKYYDFGLNTAVADNFAQHEYANLIAAHATDANGTDNSGNPNVGVGIYSDGGASMANNGAIITVNGIQYISDTRPELDPTQVHPVEGTPTSGADSHEVIVGTDYRDYIEARGGDDTIYGEAGDDILNGGGGIDRIYGGAGNDVIDTGEGPDLADGGAGDDVIYGRGSGSEVGGFDQLVGGGGNDTIIGGEGIDKLSGGAGDDVIFGDGLTNIEMGNTDPFTHGGDGNDYIDGGAGGDLLYGDEGDDLVVGAQDQDIVQGNLGDDILRPGNPSQAINGGPDEVIGDDGYTNNGFDLIDFSDYVAGAGVTIDLIHQINPTIAIDGTTTMPAMFQLEGIIGTRNNDTINGDSAADLTADFSQGNNWLVGGSGDDTLQGNGGNDVIIGDGIRLDSLIGSYSGTYTLNDTYADASHRNTGTLQNNGLLDAVAGFDKHYTDMLSSAIFKDLELGGSAIAELNGVTATRQGDGGTAGASDTAVFTGNLADYSIERIFYNTAHQGVITAYVVTDNRATNQLDANGVPIPTDGTDIVVGVEFLKFADGLLAPNGLFNVRPDGTLAFTVVENPLGVANANNAVRLNPASSLFDADNISVSNPTGAVTTGITYSWLSVTNVPISTSTGANPFVDAGGRLVVHTTAGTVVKEVATYTDALGHLETITKDWNLVVGTSNSNSNTPLNGTANSDAIFGLGGNDTLNGLAGVDRLYGGAGNDTLNGGADNDYLDGGSGSNSLRGGSGDDLYIVNSNSDTVDERVYVGNTATPNSDAGGIDTVLSAINYTLASSTTGNRGAIENLTLTGGMNINGTGNNLANVITGNLSNNVLNGGAGADTMIGGAGNDTYVVDNAGDVVTEGAGAGTDTVQSSITISALAANVENLTLTGNGNINGTGNSGNNVITGNGGNNTLNGDVGADTLIGGQGRDVMTGGSGADVFDFNNTNESAVGAATRDVITDFLSGTDKIDLSGIDARVNGTGSNGNQAFTSLTLSTDPFTNAQQLHYHYEGVGVNEVTVIEGNVNSTPTNGNGFAADFQIQLTGHVTLNQLTDIVM
jgi:Ca2+-binding RTX toxin-like protein